MSTLRVNTIQNSGGTGSPEINGLARAWVNFNGTGTVAIRASNNVSSITDTGVGQYTINFTTSLVDNNYVLTGSSIRISGQTGGQFVESELIARTTAAVAVITLNQSGSVVDPSYVSAAIFR